MIRSVLLLVLFSSVAYGQQPVNALNSPGDEFNPVVSADGKSLYFTRRFDADNSGGMGDPGDIWFSQLSDSGWTAPRRAEGAVNNKQLNGVMDATGELTLLGHYKPGGAIARTQGLSYAGSLETQLPARIDVKYFYNKSDHISGSIAPDRKVMVLAMESYGTVGAEDLYVSFKTGTHQWSEPKNLGSRLNTPFQEMTPYMAPDNKTLFFSSNGHGGFGGRDIFMSQRLDDTWLNWSEPVNLGPKVNTEGVELYFAYFPNSEWAVYTSTTNSDGHSDLQTVYYPIRELEKLIGDSIRFPDPVIVENEPEVDSDFLLTGRVVDTNNNDLPAVLSVSGANWASTVSANEGYRIPLPGGGIFEITVESEGFVSKQEILDLRTSEITTWTHDFTLQPIAVGVTVQLDNVLFVQGSTDLLESSYAALDLVVKMMKDNPDMEIHISGHTDNTGDARLNQILSKDRVTTVINYLENHGVDPGRMTGEGYGGSKPIAPNDSEATRRLNRRVEFTISSN